ncbi:unnamed protein product [Parascedosporium putredinis]|uniref:Uncharacterized protein n=1 Tax=Parascedosporium putredinis TaxID=1442378 RepID=A0A9P1MBF2_9PEZI|nr:unnamed protein product [Parascedosporium putredinis]CAI7994718.1 unnamed protein product [Parascedosporium putredinis]
MSTFRDDDPTAKNYDTFRDCLASAILPRLAAPSAKPRGRRARQRPRRRQKERSTATAPTVSGVGQSTAAEDLAEFIDYVATETFASLPEELRTLTYHTWTTSSSSSSSQTPSNPNTPPLTGQDTADRILPSLDPSVESSLSTYGVAPPPQTPHEFLAPVVTAYLRAVGATPPPAPRTTKADAAGCEMCGRDWVVRRGWHPKESLENVAWLCGACHRFVHAFAGHEELAREYYTVERLMAQDKVREWAEWAGKLRWKKR